MTSIGSPVSHGDGGQTSTAAEETVMVRFFTTVFPHAMPDTPFSVPISTRPSTLSDLVNQVLGLTPPARLLFLHDGRLLSCSLKLHMQRRNISSESVLALEYTPAVGEKDQAKVPVDDWVSAVRVLNLPQATTPLLLVGSYDTLLRVVDPTKAPTLPPPPAFGTVAAARHHASLTATSEVLAQARSAVLATGRGHRGPITSVAVVPRSSSIAEGETVIDAVTSSHDGQLVLWQYAASTAPEQDASAARKRKRGGAPGSALEAAGVLTPVALTNACDGGVTSVAVVPAASGDGTVMVGAGGEDGSVVITTLAAILSEQTAKGGASSASAAAAAGGLPEDPKGRASRGYGGLGSRNAPAEFVRGAHFATGESHPRAVKAVTFARGGGVLASAGLDGDIRMWDVLSAGEGAKLRDPRILRGEVASGIFALATAAASSEISRCLVSGHADHRVRVWDPRADNTIVRTWFGHDGWVYDVQCDEEDGRRLLSTGEDGAVCVWDVRSTLPLHKVSPHASGHGVLAGAWASNAIASGGKDKIVSLINLV